jgi:hypothetical protein
MRLSQPCVHKEDKAVAAEVVDFSWLLKVCPGSLTGVFYCTGQARNFFSAPCKLSMVKATNP